MTVKPESGRIGREPQQRRSVATSERMMAVTEELLLKFGQSFTLAEVAKAGRISMSSIYARFKSKDDLVRAVQERTFLDMAREVDEQLERLKRQGGDLDWTVSRVVHIMAVVHLRRARLIGAFHVSAKENVSLHDTGRDFFGSLVETAANAIVPLCGEKADPLWINWVWRVALYSIAGKLASSPSGISDLDEDWTLFKNALAGTVVASLT